MLRIREAHGEDWPRIRDFYQRTRYSTPFEPSDRIVLAETQDGIIGALRLCAEGGVQVLRGMRVLEEMRHRHIGTGLLRATEDVLRGATCFCIPYDYLESFYGKVGFRKLPLQEAPPFLQERSREYRRQGLRVIVMRRSG